MEQALTVKYDKDHSLSGSLTATNQGPASTEDAINQSELLTSEYTDIGALTHKDLSSDIPKIVEIIPKSINFPFKKTNLNEDNNRCQLTLQEKKEIYLKKANESKSEVSRAYLKKEYRHKSIAEVISERHKKSEISRLNESNITPGTILTKVKESNLLNLLSKAPDDPLTSSMMENEPYIETHCSPCESESQTKIENKLYIEDTSQLYFAVSNQGNKEDETNKPLTQAVEKSCKPISPLRQEDVSENESENVDASNLNGNPVDEDAQEDVNIKDDVAENSGSVSPRSEFDVEDAKEPKIPILIATCTSFGIEKYEFEDAREEQDDNQVQKISSEDLNSGGNKNASEKPELYSSQSSPKEKKSPFGGESDTSELENRTVNDLPSIIQQSENKTKMDLSENKSSDSKNNDGFSISEVEDSGVFKRISSSTESEEKSCKEVVDDAIKTEEDKANTDGEPSNREKMQKSLLSDIVVEELAQLIFDVDLFKRAAEAVRKAESFPVIPNIRFRIPSPLPFEPEYPESVRRMHENRNSQSVEQASTSRIIPTEYAPSATNREELGGDVLLGSTAVPSSDDSNSTPLPVNAFEDDQAFSSLIPEDDSLAEVMFSEKPDYIKNDTKPTAGIIDLLMEGRLVIQDYFPRVEEVLPDDLDCDNVPDLEDEPMDLEILPGKRKRIVYPGIPIPPPLTPSPPAPDAEHSPDPAPEGEPNPDPVPEREPTPDPVPEREPTPDQEPAPEGEPSPEPVPTPPPQPSPEPQEEQPNSVTREHSTSEATSTSPNSQINEDPSNQETPSPRQNILDPSDISKYIRQSHTGEVKEELPDASIQSSDVQHHAIIPVINVISPNKSNGDSDNETIVYDSAPIPVSPDRKITPPKPPTPPSPEKARDEPQFVGSEQEPEVSKFRNLPSHGVSKTTESIDDVQITIEEHDTAQIPASERQHISPTLPATHDCQNEPVPSTQGDGSELSKLLEEKQITTESVIEKPIHEQSCDDKVRNLNRKKILCSGTRRRSRSFNQPTHSPKFKPIYHPGTNNEYAALLHGQESPRKKSRKIVNKPEENLIVKSNVNQEDDMDINMPFESKSDEASESLVDMPKPVNPPSEIIVEKLPSAGEDQDEFNTDIPTQTELKPEEEERKSGLRSKHASGVKAIPGVISFTQPSGPEDTTRRQSSDSSQQDTTESTGKSQKVGTTSNICGSTTAGAQNLGGSGSGDDDEDDENKRRRSSPESFDDSSIDLQKEEQTEEEKEDAEQKQGQKDKLALEASESSTSSQSDDSAPRMEDKAKLGERQKSRSHDIVRSSSKGEQSSSRSSESSGDEYLKPIHNVPVEEMESVFLTDSESISTVQTDEVSNQEQKEAEDQPQSSSSSGKRKEAPTPEISEEGPSKVPAREYESDETDPEYRPQESARTSVIRPARIIQRRQPVPIESDISEIERGYNESGISGIDASSDRDASVGELSEPIEDYAARRRLTRNQAAQIGIYQQHKQRSDIGLISSEFDRENSSPSPEPIPRPSATFSGTPAYEVSDSGSTLLPKDSASSAKSSENTLSSNSNEQPTFVLRQPPRLADLNLPQDAQYDVDTMYYRRNVTSDPKVHTLEIVPAPEPGSDKRKRSSPMDEAEPKKIKTEEDDDQPSASAKIEPDGDVIMMELNPEESVSDCDREVEAIMAAQATEETEEDKKKRKAKNQIRKAFILMPEDTSDRTLVLVFPPKPIESSFVPYVPVRKLEPVIPKTENTENPEIPKEESREPVKEEIREPVKEESRQPVKEESREPVKEEKEIADTSGEQSIEIPKEESSSSSRRSSLRKRESLEPQKKETTVVPKESSSVSPKKEKDGTSKRETAKPTQKATETKTLNRSRTWKPTTTSSTAQSKPSAKAFGTKRSVSDLKKGVGKCKEEPDKKIQRDDKDDPNSSSKGRNTNRRQTRQSPVKKPFRR